MSDPQEADSSPAGPAEVPCRQDAGNDGLPVIAPDFVEQDYPDLLDNIVPTRGYQMTPLVGLGGSAGSLPALQEFLRTMPADSGIAFVVVVHLSPDHESVMPDLLARCTAMPVLQPGELWKVEPNHVYVIPPGKELVAVDDHLKLAPLVRERGNRVAVDLFLRSLADTHGPHGAAVILSGADGDGALGLKRVKERGGLTIAQDPDQAEFEGMPRSAVETGMVDWILKVGEMPARLIDYFNREKKLKLPPEDEPPAEGDTADSTETTLGEILTYLRTHTGRDFSYYKRATIIRRIGRRMQVNEVNDLASYLAFLRLHPGESGALLHDLLISVTNFFRDRESFESLEKQIPGLFQGKGPADSIRVWVAACATGDEAYSIAILLMEYARQMESPPSLHIFASDLDKEAIAKARMGHFPDSVTADVSEERLRKFFIKERSGYQIRREVRELVLFAEHDLLKDPPFSRMDLVSCRNLLIYLNREAQQRAIAIFNFALRPGGVLFLGSSESVGESSPLFAAVDKKHRIYQHRPAAKVGLPPLPVPLALPAKMDHLHPQGIPPAVHGRRFVTEAAAGLHMQVPPVTDRATLVEFHFKMLERLGPPSILIDSQHRIAHVSESAGGFLKVAGGEPTSNLLRMVHPMARIELRTALTRAAETGAPVRTGTLGLQVDGDLKYVTISIIPTDDPLPGHFLVMFETARQDTAGPPARTETPSFNDESMVQQLEQELQQVKTELRETIEQYEAGTQEMRASNEELHAMNEELRSATEELETSREELQSINEELTTVNAEMKSKVDELAHTNSDLQNLMASTSIATVFLDRDLGITRYTPNAVELFRIIPSDLGRPLNDLRYEMEYPELISDAGNVLQTLVPLEREVRVEDRWFLARLQPYRTVDDHIAGVVLTFVDITERKRIDETLREHVEELTRFNAVAVGRENRMIDLKKEINELSSRLGEGKRYPLDFE